MLITRKDAVVVQGITGKQGTFWTGAMRDCGTRVVAGTSPGKGGQVVDGIPVYDSVVQAAEQHDIGASVLFVPPLAAKAAALDALSAGVRTVVLLTEFVPVQDVMEILAEANDRGSWVVGPNTAGVVMPGESSVGIMPGFATNIFQPGTVGVVSRSGSLGTLGCFNLVAAGYGQSVFLGIGGDPLLGVTMFDALRVLNDDPRTEAIVLLGEIGGSMEEETAALMAPTSKPVVALIAGRTAPAGKKMGHAGAIVSGGTGTGEGKVEALRDAGASVVDTPGEIGAALEELGVRPGRHPVAARTSADPAVS